MSHCPRTHTHNDAASGASQHTVSALTCAKGKELQLSHFDHKSNIMKAIFIFAIKSFPFFLRTVGGLLKPIFLTVSLFIANL